MKSTTLTIRLDTRMRTALNRLAKATGKPRSQIAREALQRTLAVQEFRTLRQTILKETEKSWGVLSDDDIFEMVS